MQIRRIVAYLIALVGFFLELRCYTRGKEFYGVFGSPVVWFIGSLMVAGGLFWSSQLPRQSVLGSSPRFRWVRYVLVGVMLAVLMQTWQYYLPNILSDFKIDPRSSDIIPSFQLYAQRWLADEDVYAPLVFSSWTVYPTYLTTMWLPYILAEFAHFDYRLLPAGLFTLYAAWHGYQLAKSNTPWWMMLIELAAFPWVMHKMLFYKRDDFGWALEMTPAVYYLVLGWCLIRPNAIKVGIGVAICLLARYSFTFWLPAMLLIWWIDRGFKKPFLAGVITAVTVCLLYIFPYFAHNPSALSKGLANYDRAALGQWTIHTYQPDSEIYPHHLSQGLSFALRFWKPTEGSAVKEFTAAKQTHVALCGLTALLLVGVFWWKRNNKRAWNLYSLAGLKLYFTVFYGFLFVPFSYLYQVPLLFSFVVLAAIRDNYER